jgi:hypothetical protein
MELNARNRETRTFSNPKRFASAELATFCVCAVDEPGASGFALPFAPVAGDDAIVVVEGGETPIQRKSDIGGRVAYAGSY